MTKKADEVREWTLKSPGHFNAWHVGHLEVTDGPIIKEPLVKIRVIEKSAYNTALERIRELEAALTNHDEILKIVESWKHHWFFKEGETYRDRAFGIDANMKHHLADMIVEYGKKALKKDGGR